MLKSINKQVVVIRYTGTDLFEEALLIVNPKMYGKVSDEEMAEAARALIRKSAGFTIEIPVGGKKPPKNNYGGNGGDEGPPIWMYAIGVLVLGFIAIAVMLYL